MHRARGLSRSSTKRETWCFLRAIATDAFRGIGLRRIGSRRSIVSSVDVYCHDEMRFLLALMILAVPEGCSPSGNLPPLRTSSQHFRYYARSESAVQGDIIERLERSRADVFAYLNLQSEAQINYYLFDDQEDLARNSECGSTQDCAVGHDIFSVSPLLEHELVHAYLADVGFPAAPLREGMAEALGCNRTNLSTAIENDWRRCVSEYPTSDVTIYASDQRFAKNLILQNSPGTVLRYYRISSDTRLPNLFAKEFMSFWGLSIDDVWAKALMTGVLEDGVSPICPCSIGALSPGMNDVVIPHVNAGDYRPIAVGPDSSALFRFAKSTDVLLQDCARETPAVPLLDPQAMKTSLILIQGLPTPHFLAFPSPGTEELSVDADPRLSADCGEAASLVISSDIGRLMVIAPPLGVGARQYLKLASATTRMIQRKDPAIAGIQGGLRACTDCTLSSCTGVTALQAPVPVSDGYVLELSAMPSPLASTLQAVSIEFL